MNMKVNNPVPILNKKILLDYIINNELYNSNTYIQFRMLLKKYGYETKYKMVIDLLEDIKSPQIYKFYKELKQIK